MKPVEYILKFKKDFYEPIRDNVKKSTIRSESKPLNTNDFVFGYFGEDKVCLLQITDHYARKFKDLTQIEAEKEGYKHVNLLKHSLKNIYPNLNVESYVYIYNFDLIKNDKRATSLCNQFVRNLKKDKCSDNKGFYG